MKKVKLKISPEELVLLAKQKNFEILNLEEYRGITSKLKIRCLKCNKEMVKEARCFDKNTATCEYCSGYRSHPYSNQEVKNKIYDLVKNEYTMLSPYIKKDEKFLLQHNVCGKTWKVNYFDFIKRGVRCPFCKQSKGEKIVAKILNKLNLKFHRQYAFENLKYKKKLRFDFYIPDFNLVIEVDGIWHIIPYRYNTDEISLLNFKERQLKDNLKNKFCKENNLKLLRIPSYPFKKNLLKEEYVENLIKRFIEDYSIPLDEEKRLMDMAKEVSNYSDCFKMQVGAVIAYKDEVISTGANQISLKGSESCKDLGYCYKKSKGVEHGDNFCKVLHAEEVAIINALNYNRSTLNATLYCTHRPCLHCTKLIIGAGIKKVVYLNDYDAGELSNELLKEANIELVCLK